MTNKEIADMWSAIETAYALGKITEAEAELYLDNLEQPTN